MLLLGRALVAPPTPQDRGGATEGRAWLWALPLFLNQSPAVAAEALGKSDPGSTLSRI